MKPLGIGWGFVDGVPMPRVIKPSPVEDAIWAAVEKAIDNGWAVEQFRREAASCWEDYLRQYARDAAKEWSSK